MMQNHRSTILAPFALIAVLAVAAFTPFAPHDPADFRAGMRKLWDEHASWTRGYIVAATANLPEKDATAKRLLKNQDDIGNAIKEFYGDAAGVQLTGLLKGHIMIAVEIIDAAKAGDNTRKDAAAKRWSMNADSIATFLSTANPKNWPAADLKSMLRDHLTLTTNEVVAHLEKRWDDSIAAYDKVHDQMMHMADALSSGIMKQFPAKFDRVASAK